MSKQQSPISTAKLTPAQHATLAWAVNNGEDGKVAWFPERINGGARNKLLAGLQQRALIEARGKGRGWFVSAAGYQALGRSLPAPGAVPAPAAQPTDPELDAIVAQTDAELAAQKTTANPKPRTREDSKQAQVIAMLQRPGGATIAQICEITSWQAHTVRGAFAGAFKKKLGLVIVSEKAKGAARVYRIAP